MYYVVVDIKFLFEMKKEKRKWREERTMSLLKKSVKKGGWIKID